jgi:hypothetical protein
MPTRREAWRDPAGRTVRRWRSHRRSVLSHQQWKAVIDVAKAVNADIVTSLATGLRTRDELGGCDSSPDRSRVIDPAPSLVR